MRAAIFDMDGLLIDSEPLWRQAEVEVYRSVGVPLTHDMCRETMGLRLDEVARYWHDRFPTSSVTPGRICERILDRIQNLVRDEGVLMEGSVDLIRTLHAEGLKLAIATSSPTRLIDTVVDKFDIGGYFSVLHSAEHEAAGKPDPAVYLSTLSLLQTKPVQCIAFEDSLAGVRSAKAAGAMVVAVPSPEDRSHPGFAAADIVLDSLKAFSLDIIGR